MPDQINQMQRDKLTKAWTELTEELGRRPGIQKLRQRANVGTETAVQFVEEQKKLIVDVAMPKDALTQMVAPQYEALMTSIWAKAVEAVTESAQTRVDDELSAAIANEIEAVERTEQVRAECAETVQATHDERDEALARADAMRDAAERVPVLEARIAELELEIVKKDAILDFVTAQRTDMTELRDMLTKLSADKNDEAVETVESNTPGT